MAKKSISLRVDPEKIKKLDDFAYEQKRSRSFIVEEAIEDYISYEEQKAAHIAKGLADIEAGRTIPHSEMKKVFEDMRQQIKEALDKQA